MIRHQRCGRAMAPARWRHYLLVCCLGVLDLFPSSTPTGAKVGCGPLGPSCAWMDGRKGHSPCDKSKGACHCGAM